MTGICSLTIFKAGCPTSRFGWGMDLSRWDVSLMVNVGMRSFWRCEMLPLNVLGKKPSLCFPSFRSLPAHECSLSGICLCLYMAISSQVFVFSLNRDYRNPRCPHPNQLHLQRSFQVRLHFGIPVVWRTWFHPVQRKHSFFIHCSVDGHLG